MNCNYNPLYEGKTEEDIENKVTTENIVIQNQFVIFEPRADLEIVAENSPRRRRTPRPPPPPPPPPYPPGLSP
jgi:U5 snRNP spliceosome subunit